MTKTSIAAMSACLGLAITASAVQAQAPQVVPGSANAASVTNSNREQNAGYNRVVGSMDPVKQGEQPKGLKGRAVPATPADVKVGSALRDSAGVPIGTISAVEADGITVDTGQTKIKVPAEAFGKDDAGLLLGITAAKFSELIAGAKANN